MAITNGYLTLAEYKAYKSITSSDTGDDAVIEKIIEGASRFIDNISGQTFYSDTGETRYFTAEHGDILFIPNLYGITTLKTDEDQDGTYENTWNTGQTTGDFYLMPFNASIEGRPYSWIQVNEEGDYVFPTTRKGVEIKADWGYSAVPADIKMACYEIVNAAHGRRTGQNLTGTAEVTGAGIVITPEDITPYARTILASYKRGYGR